MNPQLATSETMGTLTIDLQYLTVEQAKSLISMFDSPAEYAENFSAINAITTGLYTIILDTNPDLKRSKIARMFRTVNKILGFIIREDIKEHLAIWESSCLKPEARRSSNTEKGGESC